VYCTSEKHRSLRRNCADPAHAAKHSKLRARSLHEDTHDAIDWYPVHLIFIRVPIEVLHPHTSQARLAFMVLNALLPRGHANRRAHVPRVKVVERRFVNARVQELELRHDERGQHATCAASQHLHIGSAVILPPGRAERTAEVGDPLIPLAQYGKRRAARRNAQRPPVQPQRCGWAPSLDHRPLCASHFPADWRRAQTNGICFFLRPPGSFCPLSNHLKSNGPDLNGVNSNLIKGVNKTQIRVIIRTKIGSNPGPNWGVIRSNLGEISPKWVVIGSKLGCGLSTN